MLEKIIITSQTNELYLFKIEEKLVLLQNRAKEIDFEAIFLHISFQKYVYIVTLYSKNMDGYSKNMCKKRLVYSKKMYHLKSYKA